MDTMSIKDEDNYLVVDDYNGGHSNGSPMSNRRNVIVSMSPMDDRRDRDRSRDRDRDRERDRSRSRSYDDRRRGGHRSRSPRRNRDHSRDRGYRRSDNSGRSGRNQSRDRDMGLKYRWEKTIYVSNIPYDVRWPDLKDLFRNKVGEIVFCEVFEKDNRSLGVGSIEFKNRSDAEKAVEVMHQYEIGGRKISVRLDNEGFKTRQAKEMSDNHANSSSSSSSNKLTSSSSNSGLASNGSNGNHVSETTNSAAALALALASFGGANNSGNAGSNILSLLGMPNPLLQSNGSASTPSLGSNPNLLGVLGGSAPNMAQTALLNQLAAQLKVEGPVTNRIFVASLDYKVDESKIKEVFALAGHVQSVSLFKDRDGKSRGMAVVEYDTPFEALNAVSMFNHQTLIDRQMTVRFDTKPPKEDESTSKNSSSSSGPKLPSGLKSIGTSLGINTLLGTTPMNNQPTTTSASGNPLSLGALTALTGLNGASGSSDLSSLTSSLGLNLNGSGFGGLLGNLNGNSSGNSNGYSTSQQSGSSNGSNNLNSNSNGNASRSGGSGSNQISKIFVKNIPFSWDERKLKEKFRQAGQIEHADIKVRDGKSRGCGLIRFATPAQANKAVELFNGSRFEGRTLEVKLDLY